MATRQDTARLLFGGTESATRGTTATQTASVRHGTAQADSSDGSVSVLLDGAASAVTLACDTPIEQGDRVSLVSQGGSVKVVSAKTLAKQTANLIVKSAYIDELTAKKITVDNLYAATAYISALGAGEITAEKLTATAAYIAALTAGSVTADNLVADHGTIGTLKSDYAEIQTLVAGKADITLANIDTANIHQGFVDWLSANYADIKSLRANYAHITDGVIDNAHIGWANIDDAKIMAANIDVAEVNKLLAKSAMISNAIVGDQTITGELTGITVSANLLTAGTIDAANINVTNLNAANITVGTINGNQIGPGAIDMDNLAESIAESVNKVPGLEEDLEKAEADIAANKAALEAANGELDTAKADIAANSKALDEASGQIAQANKDITQAKADIKQAKADIAQADAAAQAAQTTADGKSRVYVGPDEPAADGLVQGDLWRVVDGTTLCGVAVCGTDRVFSGAISEERVWNGTQWVSHQITASSVLVPSSVGAVLIADGAVTAPKIVANAVTAEKIAAEAVTADKLTANSVTAEKITANAVNADKLTANAVTAEKIAAGAVTADAIAANSVNADKIVSETITGEKIAGETIAAKNLKAECITAGKIAANAVKANNILAGTITGEKIAGETITGEKIAGETITATKLSVKELAAIGATIGGTVIDETCVHTAGKDGSASASPGIYWDSDGLFNAGDGDAYVRIGAAEESLCGVAVCGQACVDRVHIAIQADEINLTSSGGGNLALKSDIKVTPGNIGMYVESSGALDGYAKSSEITITDSNIKAKVQSSGALEGYAKSTEVSQSATNVTTSIKKTYIDPISTRVSTQETLVRQSGTGVEVARKVGGSYTATRTNMSEAGFAVLSKDGTTELSHLQADNAMLAQGALQITGSGSTSTVTQSGVYGSMKFTASNGLIFNNPASFPSMTAYPAASYNLDLSSTLQTVYMTYYRAGLDKLSLSGGGIAGSNSNEPRTAVASGFAVFEGMSAGQSCVLALCNNDTVLAYAMGTAYGSLLTLTIPATVVSANAFHFYLKARTGGSYGFIGGGSDANCKAALTVIY